MAVRIVSEDDLYAIEATLKTNLPGVISEINALKTDLTLKAIGGYDVGFSNVLNRSHYPFIAVQPGRVEFDPSGQNSMAVDDSIDVVLAVTDTKPTRLTKQMMRYAEGIRYCIQRNSHLGGACNYAYVQSIDWYPGAAGKKQLSVAVLKIQINEEVG